MTRSAEICANPLQHWKCRVSPVNAVDVVIRGCRKPRELLTQFVVCKSLVVSRAAGAVKKSCQFGRQGLRPEWLRAGGCSSNLATSFRGQGEVHLRMNQRELLKHLLAAKSRSDLHDGIWLRCRKKQASERFVRRQVMPSDVLHDQQISFVESWNVGY